LELAEEASANAASGGATQTNLAVDDDRGVDVGSEECVAECVEVWFEGSGRVAHWNAVVSETRVLFFQSLHHLAEGNELLNLKLALLLGDVMNLDLAIAGLGSGFQNFVEFLLISLDGGTGDVAKFGVFTNLVWWTSADWVSVDVDDGLLAHVDPNDGSILGVLFTHLFDALFEALLGGLSTAVDFVARDPSEVGDAIDLVLQLLDLFEMVQHGGCLPYLGVFVVTHFEWWCESGDVVL